MHKIIKQELLILCKRGSDLRRRPSFRGLILLMGCMILWLSTLSSCHKDKQKGVGDAEYKEMHQFWSKEIHAGHIDTIVKRTRVYYQKVKGVNPEAEARAAFQLAQAYTILENHDSARYFIDAGYPLMDVVVDPELRILYYNIEGALSLKYELDYPASLSHFYNGYLTAKSCGHKRGMITMLSNIVYIYYVLKDPHGLDYAREAQKIMRSIDVADTISEAHTAIAVALMDVTNHRLDSALMMLNTLDSLIPMRNLYQLAPLSLTARGDILANKGEYDKARQAYSEALRYAPYAEPSFRVMTLYHYGSTCEMHGDYTRADSLYHKALAISKSFKNLEFRGDILLSLAKMHSRTNQRNEALKYYEMYHNHIDSLNNVKMVQDFNNLILVNHQLEKEKEVQKYKIANLRNQKVVIICAALLIVLLVALVSVVIMHRRRRNLYDATVRRMMQGLNKQQMEKDALSQEGENGDSKLPDIIQDSNASEIFEAIEKRMKEHKDYRKNTLSLEAVAASVGTNRTYASRAVNGFAGVSFSRYVNNYRIAEAVELLSNPNTDILIKELAYSVGFSSDSAFSKIFKKEIGMTPKEYRRSVISISKE